MAGLFGDMLRDVIAGRGWSVNRFASTAKCAQGHVSGVIAGKKRPSIAMAYRWADTLKLAGTDRARFMLLAAASHLPAGPRDDLAALAERACGDRTP